MQTRKSPCSIHSLTNVIALLALAFISAGATTGYAATLVVTNSANNGPGSLRQALADAVAGSTITFAPSLSGATIYLASELTLSKDVTIDGSALASRITISGDSDGNGSGNVRVFVTTAEPNFYTLDSLQVAKGFNASSGGGIYNMAYMTLRNASLSGNFAGSTGGGIFNSGVMFLIDTTLSGNSADIGGGIHNLYFVSLANTTLSANHATTSGGGIYNAYDLELTNATLSLNAALGNGGGIFTTGELSITSSALTGNTASGPSGGGAIFISIGTVTVDSSTISGNTANSIVHPAVSGGGIYNVGNLTVTRSTLSGNFASGFAGGIFNNSTLTITNSTIAGNSTNGNGGGVNNGPNGYANVYNTSIVYNVADADADQLGGVAGGVYSFGTFNMRNTLIAGNSVSGAPVYDDCGGTIRSYGRDLIGALSTVTSGTCGVVSVVGTWARLNDLNLLGILQSNGGPTRTVALLPGSNAIDGADPVYGCTDINGSVIPSDQRSVARPEGVRCDVGAYEYTSPIDSDQDGIVDAGDNCTLKPNPSQCDSDGDGYGNQCDGDLNNNDFTNAQDATLFRAQLGKPSVATSFNQADLNCNGFVNAQDNTLFRGRLGSPPGPSGFHP